MSGDLREMPFQILHSARAGSQTNRSWAKPAEQIRTPQMHARGSGPRRYLEAKTMGALAAPRYVWIPATTASSRLPPHFPRSSFLPTPLPLDEASDDNYSQHRSKAAQPRMSVKDVARLDWMDGGLKNGTIATDSAPPLWLDCKRRSQFQRNSRSLRRKNNSYQILRCRRRTESPRLSRRSWFANKAPRTRWHDKRCSPWCSPNWMEPRRDQPDAEGMRG